jgi:hypothetical protein
VNTYTTGAQYLPDVAMDAAGDFLVVWQSNGQEGNHSIFGQIYLNTGAPFGGEFRVNTYTTDNQAFPSVASTQSGAFLVTWQSYLQDGSSWGVYGQRIGGGVPQGPEFRVNTYTTGGQFAASVAMDTTGNYEVVAWHSNGQDGSSSGIFGQRMRFGLMVGSEFRVNTYTTNAQSYPAVAVNSFGLFVVVWQSTGQDGSQTGVFGQAYDFSGLPNGPEFRVNTYTTSYQQLPDVAIDFDGNFVVAWSSYGPDGSNYGIFGQRHNPGGVPFGTEFRVNTFTTNGQNRPAVAADSLGNFVVTWDSQLQDGLGLGVFGQRYGAILPVELMHYGVE